MQYNSQFHLSAEPDAVLTLHKLLEHLRLILLVENTAMGWKSEEQLITHSVSWIDSQGQIGQQWTKHAYIILWRKTNIIFYSQGQVAVYFPK